MGGTWANVRGQKRTRNGSLRRVKVKMRNKQGEWCQQQTIRTLPHVIHFCQVSTVDDDWGFRTKNYRRNKTRARRERVGKEPNSLYPSFTEFKIIRKVGRKEPLCSRPCWINEARYSVEDLEADLEDTDFGWSDSGNLSEPQVAQAMEGHTIHCHISPKVGRF